MREVSGGGQRINIHSYTHAKKGHHADSHACHLSALEQNHTYIRCSSPNTHHFGTDPPPPPTHSHSHYIPRDKTQVTKKTVDITPEATQSLLLPSPQPSLPPRPAAAFPRLHSWPSRPCSAAPGLPSSHSRRPHLPRPPDVMRRTFRLKAIMQDKCDSPPHCTASTAGFGVLFLTASTHRSLLE